MTPSSQTPAVLVFLKAPVPGVVKTRLARDVGVEAACRVYRQLVERQIAALPLQWPVEIHFTPESARPTFEAWLGSEFEYHTQPGGDLGFRLHRATDGAFLRGHPAVLLIGGDCPSLDAVALGSAATLLDNEADVVIGPAMDGGYYLLGLRKHVDPTLVFEDIPWSGPEVARRTAGRAHDGGHRLAWLEEREDVDDLAAYRRAVAAGYVEAIDA